MSAALQRLQQKSQTFVRIAEQLCDSRAIVAYRPRTLYVARRSDVTGF